MKKLLFLLLTAALALPMTAQRNAMTKALANRSKDRNVVLPSTPLQINDWSATPSVKQNRGDDITWSFETQDELDEWTFIDNDGDGYCWAQSDEDAASGDYSLCSDSYISGVGALSPDNWMISPVVSLKGELSLSAVNYSSYFPEKFAVYACVGDGTSIDDFVMISDGDITPPANGWKEYVIDLSGYDGVDGRIAIRHYDCNDNWCMFIDDVSIYTPLPPVNVPENLRAITTATNAGISWEDAENIVWNLRYRPYSPDNKLWDFEEGMAEDNSLPGGWTSIDADGDGHEWYHLNTDGEWNCHSGAGHVTSASYAGSALNPDNWLVSPQAKLFGKLSLWINGQDPEWPDEVFAVYVSTGDPTDPDSFVKISEDLVANGVPTEYVFDMSEYDGQMGYVAVRHFDCSDNFRLNVDDVSIGYPWTSVNDIPNTNHVIDGLTPETTYEVQVQGVAEDERVSEWTEPVQFTTEAVHVVIPDVYLLGQVNDQNWAPNVGTPMTYDAENEVYTATVNLNADETFGFTTELAMYDDQGSWDYIEPFRFGPESNGNFELLDQYLGQELTLTFDAYGAIKVLSTAEYKITVSLEGDGYIMVEKITPEPQGLRGDVDDNGTVDVLDATALINYLLYGDSTGINLDNANCDLQEGVDITDATALINYLLNNTWEN